MSKLFISLLFLLFIIYLIVISIIYIHEWQEKCNYKKMYTQNEHEIELKQIEINNLKHELAEIKKSLYNKNKEDKNGIERHH